MSSEPSETALRYAWHSGYDESAEPYSRPNWVRHRRAVGYYGDIILWDTRDCGEEWLQSDTYVSLYDTR